MSKKKILFTKYMQVKRLSSFGISISVRQRCTLYILQTALKFTIQEVRPVVTLRENLGTDHIHLTL